MITGDHAAGTATAIGREMGITENPNAFTGAELEAASDEDLRKIVPESDIFAVPAPNTNCGWFRPYRPQATRLWP